MERAEKYEDMTLAEHRADLKERARVRAVHAALAANCDACITLAAPGGAPEGLASTGNPEFAVPLRCLACRRCRCRCSRSTPCRSACR